MNPSGEPSSSLSDIVLIPHRPGGIVPLVLPSHKRRRTRAEIDELFGPPVTERPGWVDVALVVGGAGLMVLSLALSWGASALVSGVILLVLGLALPARSMLEGVQRRRDQRALSDAANRGTALRVDHPELAAAVDAYAGVVDAVGGPRSEVVDVAHELITELAREAARSGTIERTVRIAQGHTTLMRSLADEVRRAGTPEQRALHAAHQELDGAFGTDGEAAAQALLRELRADGEIDRT